MIGEKANLIDASPHSSIYKMVDMVPMSAVPLVLLLELTSTPKNQHNNTFWDNPHSLPRHKKLDTLLELLLLLLLLVQTPL